MGDSEDLKTRVMTGALDPAGEPDSSVSAGDLLSTLPVKPQERYRFIRSIGFGGMKGVLLVADADTSREVAMAIMPDFRDPVPIWSGSFARRS